MCSKLDDLAAEEPLEIRLNGRPITVTMRTPGDDFELAVGFLVSEGIVRERSTASRVAFGRAPGGGVSCNIVEVTGDVTAGLDLRPLDRHFPASSSCGICGKTSIQAVRRHLPIITSEESIDPDILCRLPSAMRDVQTIFGRTGGLHAAAVFDPAGNLVVAREDIGRHNAVDKVIGRAWLDNRFPLSNHILIVSGRAGFEVVQKAAAAGVPIVASVSAPSTLAVELARDVGLTLAGFLRGARFVVYSGQQRISRREVA